MTRNSPERRRSPASGSRAGRSGSSRHSRSAREEEERRRRRREEEEEEERHRHSRSRSHRHRSRSSSRDRSRRHRSSSRGSRRRRSRSRRSESMEKRASKEKEKSGAKGAGTAKTRAASDGASALQVAAARAAALQTGGLGAGPAAAMTPQLLIQQSLAMANELAKAQTGIGLPSYYNPTAVNPLKYAEQMQKRKLLWQNKAAQPNEPAEEKPSSSCAKVWEKMTFSQDEDGKMTAKFRKLMGIKGDVPQTSSGDDGNKEDPLISKQEKLFRDLDQQYEMARISTHTQRGVGLGYSSQMASMYAQMPVSK